jgi:hypothetical protein
MSGKNGIFALAFGLLALSSAGANAQVSQRAQQQAAQRAYQESARSYNEAGRGFQSFENGARAVRDGAWKAEKFLGRLAE